MKTTNFRRSILAMLLSLLMLVPTVPVAHAAKNGRCEICGTACTQIVLKQANCHEQGVVEYICVNSKCAAYKVSVLEKTNIDPDNHDTICSDNGDGLTHTAHCIYHPDYIVKDEEHSFVNGYCAKCAAADYSAAVISIQEHVEIYADLNETGVQLSVGKVSIMVGNVDITRNYTISYSWADSTGKVVGTGETYFLPSDATAKEGDLIFGCYVMAMPKSGSVGKHITASCMVTVHVRDLISASAVVASKEPSFTLGQTNAATADSVMQQLYEAIYEISEGYPSYIVFDQANESDVGMLAVDSSKYYFTATDRQKKLSDVKFYPDETGAGTYTIGFTAYDTKGESFPGVLTITVVRELGSLDIAYFAQQEEQVRLDGDDFIAFWQEQYPRGTLKQIQFLQLPNVMEGILYYNYSASSAQNTPLKVSDLLHTVLSSNNQLLIDGVSFVPKARYAGHVILPFAMYGTNDLGHFIQTVGELSIFINHDAIDEISISMNNGTATDFPADDFLSVYRSATGKTDSKFSIKLLDIPENGALYVDYTDTARDKALTDDTVFDYTFYYSSTLSHEIEDITYVSDKSNKTLTDTLRYIICDEKGEFVCIGEIVFTCKSAAIVYTKSFVDVKKTDWFYKEVMDLAETGVINGYEEKVNGVTVISYKPQKNVTYGEALKMIMLATGYEEQAQTSKHWASGYLDKAIADKLISPVLTYARLDELISRRMIAQIVARAMDLPKSTRTESPFSDVPMNSQYTSYILSVYDAGIMIGNEDGTFGYEFNAESGKGVFTRAQMATVVWRINNYEK